jgi:hypothetical protein
MAVKGIILAGVAVGALVWYQQRPTATPPPPPRCEPMPISKLDPQPGLAPWRCKPTGDGPHTIETSDPRRVQGNGDALTPPPSPSRRPPRPAPDLAELADWKSEAYLDYLDAQDSGDQIRIERARRDYTRASARLDEAKRATIAD